MANETQQAKRGSFGGGVEGTYNSAATINLATGSAIPVAGDVKPLQTAEFFEIEVMAPHRGGTLSVPGPQSVGFDFETHAYPIGISGSSSRAIDEATLRLIGFGAPTYAAGPPKTLTRKLLSGGHGSVTLERQLIDQTGGSNGIKEVITGCRANGKLSHGPHDPLKISVMGCRGAGLTRSDVSSAPSVILRDTEGDRRMPFVAHKCAITEFEDEDGSAYGGRLLSLDLDLGNTVTEERAVGSTALPYEVSIVGGAPTGTLVVQRVQAADYDFFAKWVTSPKWFSAVLTYTAVSAGTSNTTDTRAISFCFQLISIEETEVGGIRALSLGFKVVWPDDSTDAGRTSADVITIVDTSTA